MVSEDRVTITDMLHEVSECLLSTEVSEEFHSARGDRPSPKMQRRIRTLMALRETLRIVERDEDNFREYCRRLVAQRRRMAANG